MAEITPPPEQGSWHEIDLFTGVFPGNPEQGSWHEIDLFTSVAVLASRQIGLGRGVRGLG